MNKADTPKELELSPELVAEYLESHPDFFVSHPNLLNKLRLPHQQKGTISLVERQLEVQREKTAYLEQEITHLMGIARQNEHIFSVFSEIFIRIFNASNEAELLRTIRHLMRDKLNLADVNVLRNSELESTLSELELRKLKNFCEKRLKNNSTYFGRLSKDERDLFFSNPEVRSVAIMQLGEDEKVGFAAFASADEDHFYPGMDTLFIKELARVLSLLLERFDYV